MLKDIRVYTIERRLTQREAIQLVNLRKGGILLGPDPRRRTVLSGTDRSSESRVSIL